MNATAPAEKAMYVHNTAGWVQIPFPFPSYHMQQPLTRQKFRVTLELSFGRKTWSLTSSQWLKKSIEAVNIRRHCKEGQVSSSVPERSEGTEVMKIAIRSGKCFGVAGMREKCFGVAGVAR